MSTDPVHLLVPVRNEWQPYCGAAGMHVNCVPLNLRERVTCGACQAWPHPPVSARPRPQLQSRASSGDTYLSTGLEPLRGERGHEMNTLEFAYYTRLRQDPTVLKVLFEPFAAPLTSKMVFWPDFLVIRWEGTLEFHETKGAKRGKSGRLLARWQGDGRAKWVMFCDKYRQLGRCLVAAGRKEQGIWEWQVTVEPVERQP